MKIAILSFFHYESSLCLSKYIAKQKCEVDYFLITDLLRDRKEVPGVDLRNINKRIGLSKLSSCEIPKIYEYTKGLSFKFNILRILSFSPKSVLINYFIFFVTSLLLKRNKYDHYILVGQYPQIINLYRFLPYKKTVHIIHEIGNHFENQTIINPYIKKLINNRSKVILPSNNLMNMLIKIPDSQNIVKQVIPFSLFETYKLIDENIDIKNKFKKIDRKIFLFYGIIKPYKGLDILFEALNILDKQNIKYHLIIAGNGEDILLEKNQNRSNLTIINRYLKNDEVVSLNKYSDCIVCPYKSVSQSGIVMTSFLFNKPIIASDIGEFKNVIKNNYNGILIKPNSPESLAEAMIKIINEEKFYKQLIDNIKLFSFEDKFNWDNIANDTINFLNETNK